MKGERPRGDEVRESGFPRALRPDDADQSRVQFDPRRGEPAPCINAQGVNNLRRQGSTGWFRCDEYAVFGLNTNLTQGFERRVSFDPAVPLKSRIRYRLESVRIASMQTRLGAAVPIREFLERRGAVTEPELAIARDSRPDDSREALDLGPQPRKRSLVRETRSPIARARRDRDEGVGPDPLALAPLLPELIEANLELVDADRQRLALRLHSLVMRPAQRYQIGAITSEGFALVLEGQRSQEASYLFDVVGGVR